MHAPPAPPRFATVRIPDFPAWAFFRTARAAAPVVVSRGAHVAACTARARRQGVAVGMRIDRAREVCPTAIIRPRDPALESVAWEQALDRLHGLSPFLEPEKPGWATLAKVDPDDLAAAANDLGATAALANARAWARLGALRAAPGHVLLLSDKDVRPFLRRAPVALIDGLGFDPSLAERLALLGFPHLADLLGLTKRHLAAQFGAEGRRLYTLLHPGRDPAIPLFRPPALRAADAEFDHPVTQPALLFPALASLVQQAAEGLGALHCRRLVVHVTYGDGAPGVAGRILPTSTADPAYLTRQAHVLATDLLGPDRDIVAARIELGGLRPAAVAQGSLFQRRRAVALAVRGVHRHFPGALRRAVLTPHALFPEDRVRYEAATPDD